MKTRFQSKIFILLAALAFNCTAVAAPKPVQVDFKSPETNPTLVKMVETLLLKESHLKGSVSQYLQLGPNVVLAEMDVFPDRQSGLYLLDTAKQTITLQGYGTGEIIGTAHDASGNPWAIRKYVADLPGRNEVGYEAILILQSSNNSFNIKNRELAFYADAYESEQNLCSYFKTDDSINLSAELKINKSAGGKGDIIDIVMTEMTCSDLSKQSKQLIFLPLQEGFTTGKVNSQ